jgi:hypothetical protein
MDVLRFLAGISVLTLGRRLYWLFVGVAGFALGVALASRFLGGQPNWVILVIALAAGILGALLAVFVQQLAIAVAGFIAGGYVAIYLVNMIGGGPGRFTWVPFVIGGVIGVVLVAILFDWALIVLSSLIGANLIVEATNFRRLIEAPLFVVLLAVGIGIQAYWMHRDRPEPERAPPAKVEQRPPE